ncbi:MAG: hypothetical protein RL701_6006 [Pseudomonadota bacterium]
MCQIDGDHWIFILALRSPDSAEAAQFYGALPLTVDTTPPEAPWNVHARAASEQVELSWERDDTTKHTWLLVDRNAKASSDAMPLPCSSSRLPPAVLFDPADPNARAALPEGIVMREFLGPITKTTFEGSELGTSVSAAVVIAADAAFNVSAASKPVCLPAWSE